MAEEIVIRGYREGDEEDIVELLFKVFREWRDRGKRSLDFWKWMYLDNPLGDRLISVATVGDKIIGVKHDLFLSIKHGDKVLVGCLGTDSAVDPDFRRRGIYWLFACRRLAPVQPI